ncbi:MAG TPA: bifunctional serine/threonine-protein kinase/formylglycine-generating enzyme family protein [Gammaproteobacteria bacterium]
MTEFEDKTRIQPDRKSTGDDEDKTRIAITHGSDSRESEILDDKTRIQTNHSVDNDKTRISTNNKTRPEQLQSIADDSTRIAPPKNNPDTTTGNKSVKTVPDPLSSGTANVVDNDHHAVLKERFVLEKVLGAGGMGIVYKARDLLKVEANDRDPYVAIKVLSDEFKAHPEAFIALQRESRKSQRIAHPNIVNVFDFDRDGDTVFMTMEYMEGKPLDKLLRQYKSTGLPTDDAWQILDGVCSALMHAHNEKIVHSDFKPGNVFVTSRGISKVFDFGIARAVAQIEHLEEQTSEDKTLFDAGNLGALTPAYASLEMLEGKTPDVRDDIYALGCVAYELFTGEHPFNKIPADEAERKKLKPKRITTITKRQWQAIEKALAFRRENRTESIDEFIRQIKYKYKPAYQLAASLAILVALFVVIYFQYFKAPPDGPDTSQIRNELEYEIRLDLHKKNITRLISDATFTSSWESELGSEYDGIKQLLNPGDEWLVTHASTIYQMYLNKIDENIKTKRFSNAKTLIDNAYRYTNDPQALDKQKVILADAIRADKENAQALLARQQERKEQQVEKATEQKKTVELFDLALKNVNQQLACQSSLNMQNLDAAINKLRSLDLARYNDLEPKIVRALSSCIELIGKSFPERAEEYKISASRIFKANRIIAAISIQPKDPCDASIAGLGSRGKRALCRDKLQQNGSGPSLVVVPGNGSIKMFAIGKYEISIGELNTFCAATKECNVVKDKDESLPATNVPYDIVNSYLKWLSKKSDRKYRLPTKNEWIYAAKAKRASLDPNRNCKLSTRGIQKGGELVKTTTGQQNDWGLVNHVGNAQEWAYDSGSKLVTIGGSYDDAMDDCSYTTLKTHTGTADIYTGFRVLREVREPNS